VTTGIWLPYSPSLASCRRARRSGSRETPGEGSSGHQSASQG
jgi:hypothetical protein